MPVQSIDHVREVSLLGQLGVVRSSPLARLSELSEVDSTGEYLVGGSGREIHVFLQDGRIAWATTSRAPHAFTRALLAQTEIPIRALRETIVACQLSREPFGECLIKRGLIGRAEVSRALKTQIVEALADLAGLSDVATVFLPRHPSYWADGTFGLGELLLSDELLLAMSPAEEPRSPWEPLWTVEIGPAGPTAPLDSAPGAQAKAACLSQIAVVARGAWLEQITLRSSAGAVIGEAGEGERWRFSGYAAEAYPAEPPRARSSAVSEIGRKAFVATRAGGAVLDEAPMETALRRLPEVSACLAFDLAGGAVTAAYRPEYDLDGSLNLARQVMGGLPRTIGACFGPEMDPVAELLPEQLQVGLRRDGRWHFGTTLMADSHLCAWISGPRGGRQPFGVALLATFARHLRPAAFRTAA